MNLKVVFCPKIMANRGLIRRETHLWMMEAKAVPVTVKAVFVMFVNGYGRVNAKMVFLVCGFDIRKERETSSKFENTES